jgi:glycosyltransferase involved in cell wall biosynthesis
VLRVAVGPYRPSGSGMASYTRHLTNALSTHVDEVHLFGFELGTLGNEIISSVIRHDLGPDPRWLDICSPQVAYGYVRSRIRPITRELSSRVDIFHIPYGTGYFDTRGIPSVVTGWSFGNPLEMMAYGVRTFRSWRRIVGGLGHLAYFVEDRRGYRAADACTFTTRASTLAWQKYCRRAVYIPCPVEASKDQPRALPDASTKSKVQFILGERDLGRSRNHVNEFLFGCAKLAPELARQCAVLLIGSGVQHTEAGMAKARAAGVSVNSYPYLPRQDFLTMLTSSDVCVQLRDIRDQGGYLSLEAMATGKPVLVSDSPGFADYVQSDVSGLVSTPNDVNAIGSAVERLVADPSLRERLGRGAKQEMEHNHSYKGVSEQLKSVYLTVIDNH